MKLQEDIGPLVKQKLEALQDTSREEMWDKISTSLDERKKKRRMIYFLSSIGFVALLFLTVTLVIGNDVGMERELPPITGTENMNSEKFPKNNEVVITPIKNDTLRYDYSIVNTEKTAPKSSTNSNANEIKSDNNIITNSLKRSSESIQKDTEVVNLKKDLETTVDRDESIGSFDSLTEGSDVKTTFYYYRGEDNSQVVTSDKKVIDSLLFEPKRVTETVKDSIHKKE